MMVNLPTSFKRISSKAIFCLRYKVFYQKWRVIVAGFGLIFCSVLLFLHVVLLPSVSGAYNDNCYLNGKKLNELRQLIIVSAKLMEKYNMTYWLDYGTLLGAVKFGDVLPWDGDADISSLFIGSFNPRKMNEEFAYYGIHRNALVAIVNGTQLDYCRWTIDNGIFDGNKQMLLNKYYPARILKDENSLVRFQRLREHLPISWVIPTTKINFLGVQVSVPREYEKCLRARYPFTYKYNIFTPYKWKCWLPCWLTGEENCKEYTKHK